MSRPRKLGLDYFSLDVDFFEDEKIAAISGEFGLKGEIITLRLLCAIYRQGYFIEWTDMIRYKLVRSLGGNISVALLDQVVAGLVRWGFFDKSLFDSAHVLTSSGIQRRYFASARKRSLPPGLPYILVSAEETPVSGGFMPQSKVKNIKKQKKKVPETGTDTVLRDEKIRTDTWTRRRGTDAGGPETKNYNESF